MYPPPHTNEVKCYVLNKALIRKALIEKALRQYTTKLNPLSLHKILTSLNRKL